MKNKIMVLALIMVGRLVSGDEVCNVQSFADEVCNVPTPEYTAPKVVSPVSGQQDFEGDELNRHKALIAILAMAVLPAEETRSVGFVIDQKAFYNSQKQAKVNNKHVQCPAYGNQTLHRTESKNRKSHQRNGNSLKVQSKQRGSKVRNGF